MTFSRFQEEPLEISTFSDEKINLSQSHPDKFKIVDNNFKFDQVFVPVNP